jgi:hypothetical protein
VLPGVAEETRRMNVYEYVRVKGQNYTIYCDYHSFTPDSYAIRYKNTDMVSAWRYHLVMDKTYKRYYMKVTSRSLYGTAGVTLDHITTPEYWVHNNDNDVVRYFPLCGYYSGNKAEDVGGIGFYWSSSSYTADEYAYHWIIYYIGATTLYLAPDKKMTVRLFETY